MKWKKEGYFSIPELDFSFLKTPLTKDECRKALAELEQNSNMKEELEFIEDIERHPEHLSSWDMDISFEEYARRVRKKAGEQT